MTDRLSRFTPNAPGLDRDAILFAAGRRSARGAWAWKVATALLIVTQVATLVALWPKEPAVVNPVVAPPAPVPAPAPLPPPASPPPDVWTAGMSPDVLQSPPVRATVQFAPTEPPLTVRSKLPDV
jgi:hypothetical protein